MCSMADWSHKHLQPQKRGTHESTDLQDKHMHACMYKCLAINRKWLAALTKNGPQAHIKKHHTPTPIYFYYKWAEQDETWKAIG